MFTVRVSLNEAPEIADSCTVVPSEDSHQSEYIAPCDARRGRQPPHLLTRTY